MACRSALVHAVAAVAVDAAALVAAVAVVEIGDECC